LGGGSTTNLQALQIWVNLQVYGFVDPLQALDWILFELYQRVSCYVEMPFVQSKVTSFNPLSFLQFCSIANARLCRGKDVVLMNSGKIRRFSYWLLHHEHHDLTYEIFEVSISIYSKLGLWFFSKVTLCECAIPCSC